MPRGEISHSIQGSWRGHYFYYAAPAEAHGFEAVFVEVDGLIEGNILDDDELGEAIVGGSFTYPDLQFSKLYRGKHSVKYNGTMSEDGKRLAGRWNIPGSTVSGTWQAYRLDDGKDLKFASTLQEEQQDEATAPMLAPLKSR